jgi:large subunit ribosomal protein L29
MKTDEIRGKTPEVLAAEFAAMKRELFDLRFKSSSQSLPDPSRIRVVRRTIARMGTVLREREIKGSEGKATRITKTGTTKTPKAPKAEKAAKAPKAAKAKAAKA